MEEEIISIMSNLRNERIDGWNRMMIPRHTKVSKTSYLDVRSLTIDMSRVNKKKECPDINKILDTVWP